MEVPINAEVFYQNEYVGRSCYVIVNPVNDRITHLVIRLEDPFAERLIPLKHVSETSLNRIDLDTSRSEVMNMEPFSERQFFEAKIKRYTYSAQQQYIWPLSIPEDEMVVVGMECLAPADINIRRGVRIHATDDVLGQVDEFLADPKTGLITHLVMTEKHIFTTSKVVTIPISAIDNIAAGDVYLNISKKQAGDLPKIPLRRWNNRSQS